MPVYKQPPTTFDELINPLPKEVQGISKRLRKSIIEALPDVDEVINGGKKMGMALYSINNTNNVICGFQPTDTMCKLFFHGWKELENRGFKLEGTGKNARHIKIRSESEFQPMIVEEMLAIVKNEFIK
jgi:hypothetical protein